MVRDVALATGEQFWIICADGRTKTGLIALVYLPKILIALILTMTGSLWLLAAESFGDLILNSLALAFVTGVDELLGHAFFPPTFVENLEMLGFGCQEDDNAEDET